MKKWKMAAMLLLSTVILPGCSQTEDLGRNVENRVYLEDKTSYVLENESLKLELDPATTYFKVTDKKSHAVWYSNPENAADDPKADGENKNMLQSTMAVSYSTTEGISATLNNFTYSIEKGLYEIEEGDGFLKVNYEIGDVDQTFMIPLALPESRMNGYLEKMDSSGQKQVKEYYRKYDINKLRASDNKDELLKMYPDLANECVYVLRDSLQDYLKQRMEEAFESAGYTMEEYEADQARYSSGSGKEKPVFNVNVIYRLDGNDLLVEVPYEELSWKGAYAMTKLTMLPFMGAGSDTEDGYLMVPEGPGGIIDFNNGRVKQNSYYADVYGWDLGQNRTELIDESRTAYPVFAVAKNDSSMMCILEDNAATATIEADISGRSNSYNYVHAVYRILHNESLDVSAKSDKSVVVFENGLPAERLVQRYCFLDSASYEDMAVSYRNYLMKKYPNLEKQQTESAPVMVSVVGAVDEVKQRMGFPMSVPVALTTYDEAERLMEDLTARGYENVFLKYTGWMNGGVTHTLPKKIKTVGELGGKSKLKGAANYAAANGIRLFLDGNVLSAYRSGWTDGFSMNRDSARFASREVAEIYDYSRIWYGQDEETSPHYLLKPQLALTMMDNLSKAALEYQAGISYRDAGYLLGSDYGKKNHVSRQAVMEMEKEKLKAQSENGQDIMINYGNDYAAVYADAITDMDLNGKAYAVINRFVPFYPMVLHGLVPYAGNPVNLSGDYTQMVLKSAEMGGALSFTFMMDSASVLQESSYTRYYGVDYSLWADKAQELCSRYQQELGHCFGQYMKEHSYVADGVAKTIYEDGTTVYVNYNKTEYRGDGVTVPARDYLVKGR